MSAPPTPRTFSTTPTATLATYRTSPDGRILDGNPELAHLFGLDPARGFAGLNAANAYADPAERATHLRALQDAAGHPIERRIHLRAPDGRILLLRDLAWATLGKDGQILHIDGVMEDVTEHQRRDEALRASEAKYRELVEMANDVVCATDPDGRLTAVSGAVRKVFGYEVEEVVGRVLYDFLHPSHRDAVRARGRSKEAGEEETALYETLGVRKDGSEVWLEVSSHAIRRDGRLVGIQGTLRDISKRKAAQAALAASEARARALLQDAVDVVYTHTLDGALVDVNEAAVRTFGYSRDEFATMNIRQLIHPDDLSKAAAATQAKASGQVERTGPYELRGRTKAGQDIWIEVTSRLMQDGTRRLVQGIARDVTARRRAEASLDLLKDLAPQLATLSVDDGLRLVLRRICEAAGWPYGEAWVPDPSGTHLVSSPAFHAAVPGIERFRKLSEKMSFQRGESLLGSFWEKPVAIWVPDLQRDPGVVRAAAARAAGLVGALLVPVLDGPRFVAGFVFFTKSTQPEDAHWRQMAERAAAQVAPVFALRQAEEALQRQMDFAEAQLAASPVPLMVVGRDGSVLAANASMVELCGTRFKVPDRAVVDMAGHLVEQVEDGAQFQERARDLYMGPTDIRIEGVWFRKLVSDLRDRDGASLGRVVYFRDVSEIRDLQARLRAFESRGPPS